MVKDNLKKDLLEMVSINPTKDKALIGAAGVHFVASQLNLRGLIALPTIRNTAKIDIVVVNKEGTWKANLQVKTSGTKVSFWPISEHYREWRSPNNFYVFVRYLKRKARFEVFLESSERVTKQVIFNVEQEKERKLKKWAPCWYLRYEENRLKQQWFKFGPKEA